MSDLVRVWTNLIYYDRLVRYPAGNIEGADQKVYVVCRTCGYEREVGVPCGEPCV